MRTATRRMIDASRWRPWPSGGVVGTKRYSTSWMICGFCLVILLAGCGSPAAGAPPSATAAANQVGAVGSAANACALLKQADVKAAFEQAATEGQSTPDNSHICGWTSKDTPVGKAPKSLTLIVFNTERLKQDAQGLDATAYFQRMRGSVGANWQVDPEPVSGIGAEAVWGGKDTGSIQGLQGQLFVQHKDAFFQIVSIGLSKAAVQTIAKAVVANY